ARGARLCWGEMVECVGSGVSGGKWREKGFQEWREILCVAQYFECNDREEMVPQCDIAHYIHGPYLLQLSNVGRSAPCTRCLSEMQNQSL
nr:hypothetical protein [Tanacetum cinerariifolium]